MRDVNVAYGDIAWRASRLGMQGWATGIKGSPGGSLMMVWADVAPLAIKAPADPEWKYTIVPSKVPAGLFDPANPGGMGGCWHGDFGSDSSGWCNMHNGVYYSNDLDGARTWQPTDLIFPYSQNAKWVDPNVQAATRTWSQKGSSDWSNPNVYYACRGADGLYRTLNKTNFTKPSGLAAPTYPTDPSRRCNIVAIDKTSAMTTDSVPRRSRVADCSSGNGPSLSTDGGSSFVSIRKTSGAGKIDTVSDMKWIGGKLFVCVVDKEGLYYDEGVSATTGGIGTGDPTTHEGRGDGLRVYDPSNDTWAFVAHNAKSAGISGGDFFQCITPTGGNGYIAWFTSGEYVRTTDGTNFTYRMGNGYSANGLRLHTFGLTKPRLCPAVANKYRYEGVGFAVSNPEVIGTYLYAPLGLGPLRTPLASLPNVNSTSGTNPLDSTKLGVWEEDTGGYVAKVGQCGVWIGDQAWLGAQDVSSSRDEDGRRGHDAVVYNQNPSLGALSDALSMARGHVPGFGTVRRTRNGQTAVSSWGYTLDGQTWQNAPKQPPSPQSNNPYVPGGSACGAGYAAIDLPGFPCLPDSDLNKSLIPYGTLDIRSNNNWVPINFFKGATQLDMRWDGINSFNGMQSATFSNIHDNACHDNDDPGTFYIVHSGSGTNANDSTNWVYDPPGNAGIYQLKISDWPNARRVYVGHPAHTANFGLYDCKIIATPTHLVIISNYLAFQGEGSNPIVLIRKSDFTKTTIESPANCTSITLGDPYPGDTTLCMWATCWKGSSFGTYYCRNWDTGSPTWSGPYAVPEFGFPSYIDARRAVGNEPKVWGWLLAALKNRGHAIGQFRLSA